MKTLNSLQNMDGKWVLITGGAGHVGQAAANALLELGAKVILVDISADALTKAKLSLASEQVFCVSCDLAKIEAINALVNEVEAITGGKMSCIINNAAFVGTSQLSGWCVPFEQQSVDTWKSCLDVNLTAPFYLVQKLMPLFKQTSGDHSVINISSIYGVVGPQMEMYEGTGMGNPAAYAASKAGLLQLTRWMASVLAPEIRVNAIVLGGIFRGQDQAFLDKYHARVPLKRMAREDDIIGAIAYLASDLSSYMTGQALTLDGGWTCI